MKFTNKDYFTCDIKKVYVTNINNLLTEFKFVYARIDFSTHQLDIQILLPNGRKYNTSFLEFADTKMDYLRGNTYKTINFIWMCDSTNKDKQAFLSASKKCGIKVELLYAVDQLYLTTYSLENCKVITHHYLLMGLRQGFYDLINDEFSPSFMDNIPTDEYPTFDACVNEEKINMVTFNQCNRVMQFTNQEVNLIKERMEVELEWGKYGEEIYTKETTELMKQILKKLS